MRFFRDDKKLNPEATDNRVKHEEPLSLEKGDLKAIIIAAIITIGPFFLLLVGTPFVIFWLLFGRF